MSKMVIFFLFLTRFFSMKLRDRCTFADVKFE